MNKISTSIAAALDHHATELMLLVFSVLFLIAYWKTRDQLIGTVLVALVSAAIAISQKRATATTNVEQADNVKIDGKE